MEFLAGQITGDLRKKNITVDIHIAKVTFGEFIARFVPNDAAAFSNSTLSSRASSFNEAIGH